MPEADLEFRRCRRRRSGLDDAGPVLVDNELGLPAIEQYEELWVRPTRPSLQPCLPVLRAQSTTPVGLIPLEFNPTLGGYVLPTGTDRDDVLKQARTAAGMLTLFSATYEPCSPSLYIRAASISQADFDSILARLCDLAIAAAGAVTASVPRSGAGSTVGVAGSHEQHVVAFLAFTGLLRNAWRLIVERPSKAIQHLPTVTDLARPGGTGQQRVVLQRAQRPDRRRTELPLAAESYDSEENRFLAFVLKDVRLMSIRLREALARHVDALDEYNARRRGNAPDKRYAGFYDDWRRAVESQAAATARLRRFVPELQTVERWSGERLADPFIAPALPRAALPDQPSARLTDSVDYGPVFSAYQRLRKQNPVLSSERARRVMRAIEDRAVHPTWRLYEVWLAVELHSTLISDFGFEATGATPLGVLSTAGGGLSIPAGSQFSLTFRTANGSRTVDAVLGYDRDVPSRRRGSTSFLRPDVYLELEVPGSLAMGVHAFAVDAKYRNYSRMAGALLEERSRHGVAGVYDFDLLVTAKEKYFDGLGVDAAFIVHSDSDPKYTYWGHDGPTACSDEPRLGVVRGHNGSYPAHRFGAIYGSPTRRSDLVKMLRCFLMYHCQVVDCCFRCRRSLQPRQARGGVGDFYLCDVCGDWWVRSHCQGSGHHRLLKLGLESFHRVPDPNYATLTACPVCGDVYRPTERDRWPEFDDPFELV